MSDYLLTRDRKRREIRAPTRYRHANVVAFTLVLAHDLEYFESENYKEVVECLKEVEASYGGVDRFS